MSLRSAALTVPKESFRNMNSFGMALKINLTILMSIFIMILMIRFMKSSRSILGFLGVVDSKVINKTKIQLDFKFIIRNQLLSTERESWMTLEMFEWNSCLSYKSLVLSEAISLSFYWHLFSRSKIHEFSCSLTMVFWSWIYLPLVMTSSNLPSIKSWLSFYLRLISWIYCSYWETIYL